MNTAAPAPVSAPVQFPDPDVAWFRVLKIQTKLHQWASEDPSRRFDDLFNLMCDPAFLALAWDRVRGNKGGRTAGVDGETAFYVETVRGREVFLAQLRADLKSGAFSPLPVRERMIPKTGGKLRRLGIPTVRDRVAQAALKLVLEPIFEADFKPCSYGFRPRRRAQDAIAEIHFLASTPRNYEWVLEGDIEACFDRIDHTALMARVRRRIGDRRVLGLVKAFCKAGILTEAQALQDTSAGTPQGGILSPLLANIALSALDEHFAKAWQAMGDSSARHRRRRRGLATYRLVRYADDFVVMVNGTGEHTEAMREEVAAVLAPLGLRLAEAKTRTVHIDEGFDFLGFRIQRQPKRGSGKPTVYTYPSRKALASITSKVKTISRQNQHQPLAILLHRLAPVLRGWANYFRHGTSKATFDYLRHYTWRRVIVWLRRKHPPGHLEVAPPPPPSRVVAHRWRDQAVRPDDGAGHPLPLPGREHPHAMADEQNLTYWHGHVESRMRGNAHVRFGGAGRGNGPTERWTPRPGPTPTKNG